MQFNTNVFNFDARVCHRYALNTSCFNVEVNPLDRDTYQSRAEVVDLGVLTAGIVDTRASVVLRRIEAAANPGARRYSLLHVIDGELTISHHLGLTTLKRGQFTLIDNSHPRTMFVYDRVTLLLVCVAFDNLQSVIPKPDDVVALVLDDKTADGSQGLFTSLIALWSHLKAGNLKQFDAYIAEDLLRDIGLAYARHTCTRHRSRHTAQLVTRVKQYIDANLGDPQLSVEMIAGHFGISSRYLRTLCSGGEKPSQYIHRRRLEECASQLVNPLYRHLSITDIAYRCGFNSSTHFARSFKAMYREKARDFRRRHLHMSLQQVGD